MRNLKLLFFIILLSFFVGALFLFFHFHGQTTEVTLDTQTPLAQAEELEVHEVDEKTKCAFTLYAKRVEIPQNHGHSATHDMICHQATVIITKDHTTTATLKVALAHINREQKTIACSQSITGHMDDMTFTATTCNYTFSTQSLEIPGMFELATANMRTIAPQATINTQTGTITCNKGIKTEINGPLQRSSRHHRGK